MAEQQSREQEEGKGSEHGFLQPRIKQRFEVLKKIGSGAYGHVWKVRCRESKGVFAIKKVFLAFQDDTDAQRVYREIALLLKLRSELVVRLKEVLPSEGSTDIYLLFEHLESDVFQAIKNRVLDPTHKKFIVYQLACALKYLHSAGVVHRDLKPSNVLINASCDVRLCDFGLSRSLASEYFNKPIMTEFIATRWYRAPQVLLGSRSYSAKSDMWSLGCLIYELYSRRTLLPGDNTIDQITKILEFKGRPSQQEIQSFKSPKSTEILNYFKVERQPLESYYGDLEISEIKPVLDHLFEYDQNKRWSAQDLLECDFLKEFRGVLSETSAKSEINLQLNDNRKYGIDRYRAQIMGFTSSKQERPKERLTSKRLFLSHRGSSHKSSLSLHGNLSKFAKPSLTTTLRSEIKHKNYQSAHISPNAEKSIDKMTSNNARKNIMKVSQRLSAQLRKRNTSNEQGRAVSKNSSVVYKSKSKKYLKPERVIKQPVLNKQNYESKLKMLKREKMKHYRNGIQA